MKLIVVTATSNLERALSCIISWQRLSSTIPTIVLVRNGPDKAPIPAELKHVIEVRRDEYLGSVPAFALGVQAVLNSCNDNDVIACLHDDLEIKESGWDIGVLRHFASHPRTGLAGFFGATGIGRDDIYRSPYEPYQLVRMGCCSNIDGAEAHGALMQTEMRVACLDGFSQIGRASFFLGHSSSGRSQYAVPIWQQLVNLGLVHHIYDGAIGMLAARLGWETYFLPVRCAHYGGRTAVADAGYADWARTQHPDGDQGFWNEGHRRVYEEFRDVLPLRV